MFSIYFQNTCVFFVARASEKNLPSWQILADIDSEKEMSINHMLAWLPNSIRQCINLCVCVRVHVCVYVCE